MFVRPRTAALALLDASSAQPKRARNIAGSQPPRGGTYGGGARSTVVFTGFVNTAASALAVSSTDTVC